VRNESCDLRKSHYGLLSVASDGDGAMVRETAALSPKIYRLPRGVWLYTSAE